MTELQLYNFLEEHMQESSFYIGSEWVEDYNCQQLFEDIQKGNVVSYSVSVITHLDIDSLGELQQLLGDHFFDEEPLDFKLTGSSICIDLMPICEYLDIDITNLKALWK